MDFNFQIGDQEAFQSWFNPIALFKKDSIFSQSLSKGIQTGKDHPLSTGIINR